MLERARRQNGGSSVTWVEADARTIRLGRRFDLVLMTGHAFQCFLNDADMRAVCETIAAHLAPGGLFIFDSRNPTREEWKEWGPEASRRHFDLPPYGHIEAWNDARLDPKTGIVSYETFYRNEAGRLWSASARIRFAQRELIAACLDQAGLRVDHWLGDWQGSAWTVRSDEIIPIGRCADETA